MNYAIRRLIDCGIRLICDFPDCRGISINFEICWNAIRLKAIFPRDFSTESARPKNLTSAESLLRRSREFGFRFGTLRNQNRKCSTTVIDKLKRIALTRMQARQVAGVAGDLAKRQAMPGILLCPSLTGT